MIGLIHRVSVYRPTPSGGEDEWGVPVESLVTVGVNVPALVQDRSSREQPRPTGVEIVDAVIYVGRDADVRANDLIGFGPRTYRVVGEPVDAGGAGHHREIAARRFDG